MARSRAPRTDYGGFWCSDGPCLERAVNGLPAAQALLLEATRADTPVRIRGSGHSMNGSSVPRAGEILVSTGDCCAYRFEEDLTVTVGAGAAVWDVDRMLRPHGFELLLCNDGGAAASTVGGYAAAGGIGAGCWLHGGFWETVAELTLVTGAGALVRCTPRDPLFRWMFGSMGQLGLVVEAKLHIRRRGDCLGAVYPLGRRGQVKRSRTRWESNVWLTLLVPESSSDRARAQLDELGNDYRDVWVPREDYLYYVQFHSFNPPLVYPRQESFVALGVWGVTPGRPEKRDMGRLRELGHAFAALVASEPGYRRYIQSELTFEDIDYASYFGPEVMAGFIEMKRSCDPRMLLGRGSVFAETPRPLARILP